MRRELVAGVLIALLAGPLAAAFEYDHPDLILQDDVRYIVALGAMDGARATLGPGYDGQPSMPLDGCLYIKVREDGTNGRIRMLGQTPGGVPLTIDLADFDTVAQTKIAMDLNVDGTHDHAVPQHPEIFARAAAWGTARFAVNHEPYEDPLGGDNNYSASFVLTPNGYREEDGTVRNGDELFEAGDVVPMREDVDWEAHLSIQGVGTGEATSEWTFQRPPPVAPGVQGYYGREPEYTQLISFPNLRFGGSAEITVTATAQVPAGQNDLTFTVRAPDSQVVGDMHVAPAVFDDARDNVTIPLDQFGDYLIRVQGSVAASQYEVKVVEKVDAPLDLNLWWDEMAFALDAMRGYGDCQAAIDGSADSVVPVSVLRPDPPQLGVPLITVAVAGTMAGLLIVGKLAGTVASTAAHRRSYRK